MSPPPTTATTNTTTTTTTSTTLLLLLCYSALVTVFEHNDLTLRPAILYVSRKKLQFLNHILSYFIC
jgi:hypothetical protein